MVGYRVLRSAARGARCRLLVGFAADETVVLKVAERDDPRFAVEAEALTRAAGEHVVRLIDAGTDERDAVLVLERLGGGTLADLLERRGTLAAGEVVTLLAPIAAALERAHAAGVAHGALGLDAVCLSDDGSPTLVGFGAAELFPPGSPEVVREGVAGVVADREALRAVAGALLDRVAGPRAEAARRLRASVAALTPGELATALFDVAAAEPVRLDDPVEPVAPRAVELREVAAAEEQPGAALPAWLLAWVPDPFRAQAEAAAARVRAGWRILTPARRRLVLGATAGVLTVALALGVLPGEPAPVESPAGEQEALGHPEPAPELPEDPVEAAVLLLAVRERCLRDLSVLCLDDVAQAGSGAYDDDRRAIARITDGAEVPLGSIAPGTPVLVERLGATALLDLPEGSDPASILLLRTEAGWRIRDYFPADADRVPEDAAG